MPNYRRWRQDGGIVFLTMVTYDRQPIFAHAQARRLLRQAMAQTRRERPWTTEAIVLLPDHLHMLWRLPSGDSNYSTRLALIKKQFTRAWLAIGGREHHTTVSQRGLRRRGVWQVRFWEHQIRDARDYAMHLDYIHLNPVKHGLVPRPGDWPYSSFHRYVRAGYYEGDWSGRNDLPGNVGYYGYDR
jgi:putative transposase